MCILDGLPFCKEAMRYRIFHDACEAWDAERITIEELYNEAALLFSGIELKMINEVIDMLEVGQV